VHEHEIGDVERQLYRRIKRMLRRDASIEAQLLLRLDLRRGGPALAATLDERGDLWLLGGQRLRDRMVRRDRDEARAEDRVGARREHGDVAAIGEGKAEGQALALADPVLLHQLDLVGPMLEP